ncbi:DUF262 domain-containing protein [Leucobacter sp. W1038]|uniref:DUF262 domain-containing protein n=1 Tax=Leucobacter sp. W1038 TaxID=3438281 RepID=UPI003D957712
MSTVRSSEQQLLTAESLEQQYLAAQRSAVIEVADQGLASLARLVQTGAIDVSPKFQRRDRWNADKQSRLIESFFLNIPIPPIYLAEDESRIGSYSVIDGKQRLTSVGAFLSDTLQLRKLERMPALNGLKFSDLPEGLQRAVEMKSMRVTTLLRQSADDLKHEVFLRLNTGGEVLNAQEIRNVAYGGPLNDLVYSLAENEFLRAQFKAYPSTPSYRKMLDAEYVVRFLAFSEGWRSFSGDIRAALDSFMQKERFADPNRLEQFRQRFVVAIETSEAIWSRDAFKWPGRDQSLAGLFDAVMIALAELPDKQIEIIKVNAQETRSQLGSLFQNPEFDEATRQGTNTPARLRYRVEQVIQALKRV